MRRNQIRRALLATTVAAAACAGSAQRGSPTPDTTAVAPTMRDGHLLTVRSDYWSPLEIVLIGDGILKSIGTVGRQQRRTFEIPAYLIAQGTRVSLEARDNDAATSYSTGLFSLEAGEGMELRLEHTLTLSTFEITHR